MADIQRRTEAALDARLPPGELAPVELHAAMRYAVLEGGKRVRALLAHAAGELAGADAGAIDAAACAVELIHAYSLVHDDMPCMDNDVLRRGKPTVHVEFGEATAEQRSQLEGFVEGRPDVDQGQQDGRAHADCAGDEGHPRGQPPAFFGRRLFGIAFVKVDGYQRRHTVDTA